MEFKSADLWDGDLDDLVNLKMLRLINPKMPLPGNIFADLVNQETLYIDTNHEEPWNLDGMLASNAKLRILRIETESVHLGKEALEGLQELEEISIEEITFLDDHTFNELESLKKVELTAKFIKEQSEERKSVFPDNMVRDNPGVEYWSVANFAFPRVITYASLGQFCRLGKIGGNQDTEYHFNREKMALEVWPESDVGRGRGCTSRLSGDYLEAAIGGRRRLVNGGRFKDDLTLASGEVVPLAGAGAVLPPLAGNPAPNRNNFSRLCPVQMSDHSPLTFSSPRNRNCRKPRACLIWPNTGSTVSILKV